MPPALTIETRQIQVLNQDLRIDCYLAQPQEIKPRGAVIVIHEVFGVNAHLRSVVDRLAQEGYVAIAPNMVQRTAPGLDLDYSNASLAVGRSHKDQMSAANIASDLGAIVAYLKSLSLSAIGLMGFCFGGHVAYLGAMLPEIRATAVFYGSGIAVLTPGGGEPTVTRSHEIQGRVDLFFGLSDPLIPNAQADAIEAELVAQGVDHQVIRYATGHGFFCEARSSFDAVAAADAWERVKALLKEQLQDTEGSRINRNPSHKPTKPA